MSKSECTIDRNELLLKIQNTVEQADYTSAQKLIELYKADWPYSEELSVLEGEVFISTGLPNKAITCIIAGLACNSSNYELYFMLGEAFELLSRSECAELCYRYSIYQCHEKNDLPFLKENLERFLQLSETRLPSLTILLKVSHNAEWIKFCLQFLGLYAIPNTYEIIFLADSPSEALERWLDSQNLGKVVSCGNIKTESLYNMGIDAANKDSDILIIDEGGLPLEHTIFNMQLSLYSDSEAGAAGSVSNAQSCIPYLKKSCPSIKEAMEYAHMFNVPGLDKSIRTMTLPGPLYLFKRDVIKQCGWFDSHYSLEDFQRKDIFFRMLHHGKDILLCPHCFSAVTSEPAVIWDRSNLDLFAKQWDVNLTYSLHPRNEIVQMIQTHNYTTPSDFHILEVGCACGATLIEIARLYPGSLLYGIELDEGAAAIAKHFASVSNEDIEKSTFDYPENYFDYIIFGDVLEHLRNPQQVLHTMKKYLKSDGRILASIPNVMHISVVKPLLAGFWTYENAGILDRTHLKFFTYQEILHLFQNEGYHIEDVQATTVPISEEDSKLINSLAKIQNVPELWFQAYQYLINAQKSDK